ncbi:hypothetical protein [Microcella sp.]|uniref:hypothetical protein n=1 Tax=Microcella sp. TaxID=1913979 RepID=UPI00256A0D1B|nr:hypothetical protein [Microcella sp.]MBX9471082.1 hypothetical protein [Microcella sp.]
MTDHDSTAAASPPPADNGETSVKPKSRAPLVWTIVVLLLAIIALIIAAVLGLFSPAAEPEAEPTATPEETVEPEPEPEETLAGYVTPETWCTAVRHTPAPDFADSPSFIWWATVLMTDDGELAAEGTELELLVPGTDADPLEATVGEFGVVEVVVPISAYGIYEIFEMFEAGDGRIVPPPFVGVEVTEAPFGPECEGPEEPALDDLILESELLG